MDGFAGPSIAKEPSSSTGSQEPSAWLGRSQFALLVAAISAAAWGQILLSAHNDIGWAGYALALGLAAGAARFCGSAPMVFTLPTPDNRLRARWWTIIVSVLFSLLAYLEQVKPTPDEPTVLIWWFMSLGFLLVTFLIPRTHGFYGENEDNSNGNSNWDSDRSARWSNSIRTHWLEAATVILLLGAALVFRLPYLERFPAAIHNDEGNCGLMAQQVLEKRAAGERYWFQFSEFMSFPTLGFFPSAACQAITKEPLWGHRLANVVLSMVSLICLFFFSRSLYGRITAVVTLGLAASAHVAIHWSRSGIHSGHAAWLTVICLFLAWKAISSGRLQWFVLLGFSLACCFLTYSAAYLIPVYLVITMGVFWMANRQFRRSYTIPALFCSLSTLIFLSPMIAEFNNHSLDYLHGKSTSMIWSNEPHVKTHMEGYSTENPRGAMVRNNFENTKYLLQDSGDSNLQYGNRGIGIVDRFTAVALIVGLGVLLGHANRFTHWPLLLLIFLNLLGGAILAVSGVQYSRIAGLALIILILPAIGFNAFFESATRIFGKAGSLLVGPVVIVGVLWVGYTNLHYYFVDHDRATWTTPYSRDDARRNILARYVRDLGGANITFIHDSLPIDFSSQTFRLICGERKMIGFGASDDLNFLGIDDFDTATFLTPPGELSLHYSPETGGLKVIDVGVAGEIISRFPGGLFLNTEIPYHPIWKEFEAYQVSFDQLR